MINELWSEVIEQDKAKEILTKIYESRRVPHAFLFYGKEGVGKFNTAVKFSILLNSRGLQKESHDKLHPKIASLQEPYVKLIFPLPRGRGEGNDDSSLDKLSKEVVENIASEIKKKSLNPFHKIFIEDSNTIKISSIREIKKFISIQLEDIKYRVVIILDAHLMNDQAQNALLKNLEEPPEGIIFILITHDKEKLLHTIQSRCWTVNFEPLSEAAVTSILEKRFQIERDVALNVAHFANGSVIDALYLTKGEFETVLEKTISVLRFSLAKRYSTAYRELHTYLKDNSDDSVRMLIGLIKIWVRDVAKNRLSLQEYYFENYTDTLIKFNNRFRDTDLTKIFSILDTLDENYSKKVNLNVLSLSLIFELSSLSIRN